MSDILTETPMSLAQAAKTLPRSRQNRPVHPGTLVRWATEGLRGIQLESVQMGGTMFTSREALNRFFARLGEHRRNKVRSAEKTGA